MQRRYLSIYFITDNSSLPSEPLSVHDLKSLSHFCKRYTPLVSVDDPNGLVLDTSGCDTLFNGERAMLERVHRDFVSLGHHVQVAIAPTPLCARVMARTKPFTILKAQDLPQALYPLPLAALELDLRTEQTLHELGIKRLLELFRLPRSQLLSRFGTPILDRIDALRGDKRDPRAFESDIQNWFIEETLCDTARDSEHLCEVLYDILKRLCRELSSEGLGLLKLEVTMIHLDRRISQIDTSLVKPSSDSEKIFRLLKLKLENFDAGLGIENVTLRAAQTKPLQTQDRNLAYHDAPVDSDVSALMDTLFNRIGEKNVFQLSHRESYIPERSFSKSRHCERSETIQRGPRPTRLLTEPEPIDVMAMLPDSPPKQIVWRRHFVFHILKADGPERIEHEWWNAGYAQTRDYYCVEDRNGLRLWVFKQCTKAEATPSWFIHGLFA